MTRLQRLLHLTPVEVGLAARAWVALLSARVQLWRQRPPDSTSPALHPASPAPDQPDDVVAEVTCAVARASKFVPAATCLAQALAARDLLARRGIGTDLRLGVARTEDGRVTAHAWLEHRGAVVLGGSDCKYQPLL